MAGMRLVGDGDPSRTIAVENRSGVGCSPRSRPMTRDHAPSNVNKQLRAVPCCEIKKLSSHEGDIAGSRDGDKSQRADLRCFCNDTMNDGGGHEHHVGTRLRNADLPEGRQDPRSAIGKPMRPLSLSFSGRHTAVQESGLTRSGHRLQA